MLLLLGTVLVIMVLTGCDRRTGSSTPEEVEFRVDQSMLGQVYRSHTAAFRFQPPVNWEQLDAAQRQAVLDALAASPEQGDYTLDVQDVFFDTDSLSFLSVSRVALGNREGSSPPLHEYADDLAVRLGVPKEEGGSADNSIASRVSFGVNGLSITQFRHVKSNRITFTLLFDTPEDALVQLDYSIPSESYQREAVKLESSIGSITVQATSGD